MNRTTSASSPLQRLFRAMNPPFRRALREDVSTSSIQTAQFLQIIYDLGVIPASQKVPESLNLMMKRGYWCYNMSKSKDSKGPGKPPLLSWEECKKWGAMFYLRKIERERRGVVLGSASGGSALDVGGPRSSADVRGNPA